MRKPFMLAALVGLPLLILPASSYADWGHRDAGWGHHGDHAYIRYHDHPHYGFHVHNFYRDEYFPIWVGGTRYYYDDGIYYNYVGGDYVVVEPPVGAVVSAIPSDFQTVVVNGVTYYSNNGTYYVYTSSGYKVVNPPVQGPVGSQSAFLVNVPSDRGGYVAVTLRRSGNGFVGPQGEFYASFPQISQLRIMYGR